MASLNLFPQFETNLMSNREVIELLLQLKSAKAHGKNYIKVKSHLVRHLLRNRLLSIEADHLQRNRQSEPVLQSECIVSINNELDAASCLHCTPCPNSAFRYIRFNRVRRPLVLIAVPVITYLFSILNFNV